MTAFLRDKDSAEALIRVMDDCCHRPLLCGGGWVTGRATWRPGRPTRPRGAWGEVWPGFGRLCQPCDWPLVSRASGHRRGDLGTARHASWSVWVSLVVCLVRCGGSLCSVWRRAQYIPGWSQVVWGEVTEVTWSEVRDPKVTWRLNSWSTTSQSGRHESVLASW